MDLNYCPHCGTPVEAGATRCQTCGATLHGSPTFVMAESTSPPQAAPASTTPASTTPASTTPASTTPASEAPPLTPAPAPAPPPAAQYPPYPLPPQYRQPYPAPSYPAPSWQGYTPLSPSLPYQASVPANPSAAPGAPGAPPGYPGYPQAAYPPYSYAPYSYPAAYYPAAYYPPAGYARRLRAPGETYALVVAWIVTVMGSLSILSGLLLAGLILLIIASSTSFDLFGSLALQDILIVPTMATLLGGVYALYSGISGIRRRSSPRFAPPRPWLFVGLTALVLSVGVALWHTQIETGPGLPLAVLPILLLSGVLPALAVLAFAAWRLRLPATRRHVWLSLFYGMTLGALLAIILEIIATILISRSNLADASSLNSQDPSRIIRLLVEISVAAPIIEEAIKPLAALLILPRLRTASGAFLVGLAGGIGFDIFETTWGYIGAGEADWIVVALERVGASLLHGLGAGMVALGFYYLFKAKEVPNRGLLALGCFAYAVLQHAINNGSAVLAEFSSNTVRQWFDQPFFLGKLPLQLGIIPFLGYDVLILAVLVYVTGRLRQSDSALAELSPPAASPTLPATPTPALPVGGAAL